MASENSTAKKRPKRPSKRRQHQSYIFRIDSPATSYSLGVDSGRRLAGGPYREHHDLTIDGTLVFPEELSGRQGKLIFLGDRRTTRELDHPEESRLEPLCVGTLTIWGQTTNYLGSLPHDAIWPVLAAMASGHFRMIVLSGESLSRGNAKIQSVYFEHNLNPEDW
jgi:hypothetical protein